jgi:hypothetical protein
MQFLVTGQILSISTSSSSSSSSSSNNSNNDNNNNNKPLIKGDRGSTVVKVLRYKSEGRWFDLRWCHGSFHRHKSFSSHYGPGVDSASNRNEYQEYFLGVYAAGE